MSPLNVVRRLACAGGAPDDARRAHQGVAAAPPAASLGVIVNRDLLLPPLALALLYRLYSPFQIARLVPGRIAAGKQTCARGLVLISSERRRGAS